MNVCTCVYKDYKLLDDLFHLLDDGREKKSSTYGKKYVQTFQTSVMNGIVYIEVHRYHLQTIRDAGSCTHTHTHTLTHTCTTLT